MIGISEIQRKISGNLRYLKEIFKIQNVFKIEMHFCMNNVKIIYEKIFVFYLFDRI